MPKKKTRWIVKVPVTLHLCAEVQAPNKKAAIEAANCMCSEVEARYEGYRARLDRPSFAVPVTDDEENTWWDPDSFDQAEVFLTGKTTVEPLKDDE